MQHCKLETSCLFFIAVANICLQNSAWNPFFVKTKTQYSERVERKSIAEVPSNALFNLLNDFLGKKDEIVRIA